MNALSRLLCRLGLHGPDFMGNEPTTRSSRSAPLERTCLVCGSVWHGEQVYGREIRYLGNWRRIRGRQAATRQERQTTAHE